MMFPKPSAGGVYPKTAAEKIAIRDAVYQRDGRRCVDCGRHVRSTRGEWNSMHLMHIKSKGAGGDWRMENLLTGCMECHAKRHQGKRLPSKGGK